MEEISTFYHDDEYGGERPDFEDTARGVAINENFNRFLRELREDYYAKD